MLGTLLKIIPAVPLAAVPLFYVAGMIEIAAQLDQADVDLGPALTFYSLDEVLLRGASIFMHWSTGLVLCVAAVGLIAFLTCRGSGPDAREIEKPPRLLLVLLAVEGLVFLGLVIFALKKDSSEAIAIPPLFGVVLVVVVFVYAIKLSTDLRPAVYTAMVALVASTLVVPAVAAPPPLATVVVNDVNSKGTISGTLAGSTTDSALIKGPSCEGPKHWIFEICGADLSESTLQVPLTDSTYMQITP